MMRFIAAIDNKFGLADDHGIPWRGKLPTDVAFFREQTKAGIVLMGAGTYRELSRPMHNHTNYVVTHRSEPLRSGFKAVHNIREFINQHSNEIINNIGGAGVFAETFQYADELVLTRIDQDFHCTKFFPSFADKFELKSKSPDQTENGITFHFEVWNKKPAIA